MRKNVKLAKGKKKFFICLCIEIKVFFLFSSIEYLSLKHLLIRPVIHVLDVCFQNVVYKFLDHPFESKE